MRSAAAARSSFARSSRLVRTSPHSAIPALLPALTLAAGIGSARHLVDGPRTVALLIAVAALLSLAAACRTAFGLRALWRGALPAAAICILTAAAGVFVEHRSARRIAGADEQIARHANDRFVEVDAAIDGGWTMRGTTMRLQSERFSIGSQRFSRNLTIYCSDPPPIPAGATHIRAEGILKRRVDGWSITVKSPRLLRYLEQEEGRGTLRRLNRRLAIRLARVGNRQPEHRDSAALIAALALGRTDELSEQVRGVYRRLGIYHLLVFSGMQIAFAAAALSLLLRKLDVIRLADWTLLFLALAAPPFAGFEPSVTRSAMMIGLYALSRILHRPTSIENLFFVSAAVRLLMVPEDLRDAGFALTYAATGGMIFIGRPAARWLRAHGAAVFAPVAYGVSAELATIPLTLLFFQQFVAGGSIATLIAAPVMAAILTLSVVTLVALGAGWEWFEVPLFTVGELHRLITAAADAIETAAPLQRPAMSPPVVIVTGSFVTAMILLLIRSREWGRPAVAVALTLPLAVSAALSRRAAIVPQPQIEMLDVGQGEAILIRNGASAMLLDGGSSSSPPDGVGRRIVRKLIARGVTRLDAVTVSHPHPDHTNGLITLFRTLPVGELRLGAKHVVSEELSELVATAARLHVPIRVVTHGEQLVCGGLPCTLFVPRLHFKRSAVNNSSLVHRITIGAYRVLLTGDIEKDAERLLVDEWQDQLSATVLKVPHHGSRSSSTPRMLDAVCPRVALISSGRTNPFGHPAEAVVDALRSRRVSIHRTDRHKDVVLWLERGKLMSKHAFDTPPGGS